MNPLLFGKMCWPKNPFHLLQQVKKSVRPTKIAASYMRSVQNDELDLILENDKASYSDLCQLLIPDTRAFLAPIVTFMVGTVIFLQSNLYFNGVPAFPVKICDNLKCETFHKGVKCYVKTLSSNRINILNSWSKLEEIVRYLHLLPSDHKADIIQQQISAQAPKRIGDFLYDADIITRAFEYFATSRAIYLYKTAKRLSATIDLYIDKNYIQGFKIK